MNWWDGAYCGPAPLPQELLLRWNFDPWLLTALIALAFCMARNGHGAASVAVLAVAFVSPLCALSSALFSARVVHHILLVVVAAPLLALSRPPSAQTPVGIPFVLTTAALSIWQLPTAYDAALENMAMYWVMQISLFASAWAFWRAVFSQPAWVGLGWVFLAYLAMGMLGAILALAPEALYAAHVTGPLMWGFSPLADQQLGGLIMWMPAGLLYAAWGVLLACRAWRTIGAEA